MRHHRFLGDGSSSLIEPVPKDYGPILKLWCLRLVNLGGGIFASRRNRADLGHEVFDTMGLKGMRDICYRDPSPEHRRMAERVFKSNLRRSAASRPHLPTDTPLAHNIAWLGRALGLTQTDQKLLHLVLLSHHHPGLENALEQMGGLTLSALQTLCAKVLGVSRRAVAQSLDPRGPLTQTGLVWVDTNCSFPFRSKVEVLSGLADRMTGLHSDVWSLFRSAFTRGEAPTLALEDYPHLVKDLKILVPYLKEALRQRRRGVNVLLVGTPGSGKTELCRSLAVALGAEVFEIASTDDRGGPVEGQDRLRGYRLAQAALKRTRRSLVFFDEIEDVFRSPSEDGPRARRGNASGLKGHVNKVLETNAVPALWVSNVMHVLDDAFIRRFSYIIRLDNPPKRVRRRILDANLQDLPVDEACRAHLAAHEGLSPALISHAASVVRTVRTSLAPEETSQALTHVLGNSLEALGMPREPRRPLEMVTAYRSELVNTTGDLAQILEGLRTHRRGTICLYGPPGTGKTAWGHHVAQQLDIPLLVKQASDLLSMYVGGTEAAIHAAFREAEAEGAVLLIDEADGFLQARGSALRQYEVTCVNEMLTNMERHSERGIFIASTNASLEGLDPAALRRFDLKLEFTYLRPEQAWTMFEDTADRLAVAADRGLQGALACLDLLTPGDFATVIRQSRMNPVKDAQDLLARLSRECEVKPSARRRAIGFAQKAS